MEVFLEKLPLKVLGQPKREVPAKEHQEVSHSGPLLSGLLPELEA